MNAPQRNPRSIDPVSPGELAALDQADAAASEACRMVYASRLARRAQRAALADKIEAVVNAGIVQLADAIDAGSSLAFRRAVNGHADIFDDLLADVDDLRAGR